MAKLLQLILPAPHEQALIPLSYGSAVLEQASTGDARKPTNISGWWCKKLSCEPGFVHRVNIIRLGCGILSEVAPKGQSRARP